jgi:hypothetical protein
MSREKTPLPEKKWQFFLDIYTQQRDMVFAFIRSGSQKIFGTMPCPIRIFTDPMVINQPR